MQTGIIQGVIERDRVEAGKEDDLLQRDEFLVPVEDERRLAGLLRTDRDRNGEALPYLHYMGKLDR